jgi:hypothetical protein
LKGNLFSLKCVADGEKDYHNVFSKIISADIWLGKFQKDIFKNFKNETLEAYKQFNTANKAKSLHLHV